MSKTIVSTEGKVVEIDEFKAVSHFSKVADIVFFIQNRDVSFLRIENEVYIQANLRATLGIDE